MNLNIIIFLLCVWAIFIFGRMLIFPIKKILKLVINSILGGILLIIINYFGSFLGGFHIGINIGTSIIVGLLGIPGAILLIIIRIIIHG